MSAGHPSLGLRVPELPTPSLLLDLDAFDSNCTAIAGHLGASGVAWRPHVKGHKSPRLAQRMVAAGATGVTCAKVGEAEAMVAGGITEILVANQPGTRDAWVRLARLQGAAWVGVAVDNVEHVRLAVAVGAERGVTIPLLIEVDIGMDRAGVRSAPDAVALAEEIIAAGGQFAGVMGYEGHLLTVWPEAEKETAIRGAVGRLVDAAAAIRAASIPVGIVSCGGTGSYLISSRIEGVTELQAGGGCLMDRFYREVCHVDLEQALFLVASVNSRPSSRQAIVDAGWKALPDKVAAPMCRDHPGVEVSQLYAEHLRLDLPPGLDPGIGERIVFVPGYSDATTVLHNEFLGLRDDTVVEVIPLVARGVLQ
jgi:D-serine deaminase-like pyridoxal phosphate-dependent protein